MDEREYQSRVTEILPALYRAARGVLRSEHDCADAVQEAILQGWLKRGQLRDGSRLKPWLTRIVINQCRNMQRTAARQRRLAREAAVELRSPGPPGATDLEAALSTLEEKYRLPLVLYYAERYSTREIAELLGASEGSVRQRMYKARRMLERRLRGDGED